MSENINRREFMLDTALATAGLAAVSDVNAKPVDLQLPASAGFKSQWAKIPDRVWIGPEYWANPLQDWRVANGRLECIGAAADRNVQLLTHLIGEQPGDLRMTVRIGRIGGEPLGQGQGSAGFRIGIRGPLPDYRNALIYGKGLDAGVTAQGALFIGELATTKSGGLNLSVGSLELRLTAKLEGPSCSLTLAAHSPTDGKLREKVSLGNVPRDRLLGNLALVANFGGSSAAGVKGKKANQGTAGSGKFWFEDWRIEGPCLEWHEDRAFGPILFNQYTLSGGILKMTAQMPPLGPRDSSTVRLQLAEGDDWKTIAEEPVDPEARTATFRIAHWNDKATVPYRLLYVQTFNDGNSHEYTWTGTVRRDPVEQPVITVADVSCNTHAAFPNAPYVAHMAKLNPDFMAFVGDQFYESTGGYGVQRTPLDAATLDYLRKWYLHGWTWRELTRDRPSVSIPDDHDVYQGNIWGEAGGAKHGTQEMGGYEMPAAWVNVVHRTQTSHHPDPYDPAPIKQGISVYFGSLTYGRISFAILADRQFKSGPEGKVPPTGGRGDHVVDPHFDPGTSDLPGLQLLGDRQIRFLREWAQDWHGAEMKAVVSQTIFTAMATTHGGERERLTADYDANGWPQTARNTALREIRKAFAFHIAGDQHLPAVVHYGVDQHRDAGLAFAGPAVNVGYPRWWEPIEPGQNRAPGAPANTGDFRDHFGNPMTVLAVANGAIKPRPMVLESLQDKASGLGLVRFDKRQRKITIECWPFLADPAQSGTQFPGWPMTLDMTANYARTARAHLPQLTVEDADNTVVQVVAETNGEVVYTLRISGRKFRPHVFDEGKYTLRVSDPETGRTKEMTGLIASVDNQQDITIEFE